MQQVLIPVASHTDNDILITVVSCAAGNLHASAQRGLRETLPRVACNANIHFQDTPSIHTQDFSLCADVTNINTVKHIIFLFDKRVHRKPQPESV